MNLIFRFFCFLVFAIGIASSSLFAQFVPSPSFPFTPTTTSGPDALWLGGDTGAMARFPNSNLWFCGFSDTFLTPLGAVDRTSSTLAANTVGIGTYDGANFNIAAYFYKGAVPARPSGDGGNILSFFHDHVPGCKFWVQNSIFINNRLYVFLVRIYPASPTTWFRTNVIARINYTNPPEQWVPEYLDLTVSGFPILGWELILSDSHLYIFGTTSDGPSGVESCLARLPISLLASAAPNTNLSTSLQYFRNDWTWQNGIPGSPMDPRDDQYNASLALKTDFYKIGINSTSGFSVRYNSGLGRWQAVYVDSKEAASLFGGGASNNINPRTVKVTVSQPNCGFAGPWENPISIFNFPEFIPNSPLFRTNPKGMPGNSTLDPNTLCYAVKERPEFTADPNNLIRFTYCNTRTQLPQSGPGSSPATGSNLITDMSYYRIKTVEVSNPFGGH